MKRKYDDSIKDGCGVDGTEGQDYTKRNKTAMDDPSVYPGGTKGGSEGNGYESANERSYAGAYTSNDSGLTRTENFEGKSGSNFGASVSRDIYDDVTANQRPGGDDNTDFDTTGPIKAGVNRSQSK